MTPTIPTDIPRLDALVRAEAERLSVDLARAVDVLDGDDKHVPEFNNVWAPGFEILLRDLSRPESRDWAARALAGVVGLGVGAVAPSFDYMYVQNGPRDRDGAPEGDDWPAGWWLNNGLGDMRFFTAADWCPDDFTLVPELPAGAENATRALALALAAVCRDG